MSAKMSPKFVVLSALAVGAIYASGYSISANTSTAFAASNPNPSAQSNSSQTANTGQSGSTKSSQASQSGTKGSGSGKSSSSAVKSTSTSSSSSRSGSSSKSSTSSGSKSSKTVNTTQQYLDGTYSGSAANRIGAVGVSVTVKGGKIANVQITSCYTHYPESYINPVLPNYVVAHQTTNIPVVSGATLSTEDFYYAVVQALQKAQNPNYKA